MEVLNFYETEEFSLWTKYARKWFEKGYISKDVLTGGSASANEILSSNVYNFTEGDEATSKLNIPVRRVDTEFDCFLSNSFGFGGTNSTLIVKKYK